jgi:arabinogalactan endo-1,4-beta-galactosidase
VTAKFPKKMKVGAMYQLKIKLKKATATGVKVTFKSSKGSVIRVDKAGKLFALKKGKATITVKAGKKKVKKTITVK